jgi:two-component system sensor histidine kinase VicK
MNKNQRLTANQLLEVLALSKNATAIYTTQDLIIEAANDAMIAFWGKDRSIIGMPLEDAVPELRGQPFGKLLQNVLETGVINVGEAVPAETKINGKLQTAFYEYEYRAIKDENGFPYCILHTAADVTERVLNRRAIEEGIIREKQLNEELAATNEELAISINELTVINSELKKSQENLINVNKALSRSQDELQFAIEAAGLATWDLNPFTHRFTGNDLLKIWFGFNPEEDIKLAAAIDIIVDTDRERVAKAINYALDYASGGVYDIDYTVLNPKNPIPRIVRAKGKALFNIRQEPIRFSGILQDITEQKQDEQRKNDFIGMVSHELKTPLTSLKAYVQMLQMKFKKNEDEVTVNALDKADHQVKKMTAMINGFLNVSRLESNKIQIVRQNFDLVELVQEVIEETKLTVTSHQIQFTKTVSINILADREKIGAVVSNLLSNAIKYSPRGKRITVNCYLEDSKAQVSVTDEGMGIKPEDIGHLFERYYRVESTHTQYISGFGIGLYLCAEIIEHHRGKIWVKSEVGKGSTFYFNIPV